MPSITFETIEQVNAMVAGLSADDRAALGVVDRDDHQRFVVTVDEPLAARIAALDLTPATLAANALASAKTEGMTRVIAYANEITARITARYPAAEVASWPTREVEARLIVDGASASVAPLLAAVAAATGDTVANLAEVVLAKAAAYRQVVAAVEAVRTQAQAAINACTTQDEIDTALDALRQQAEAMAAQMGLAA